MAKSTKRPTIQREQAVTKVKGDPKKNVAQPTPEEQQPAHPAEQTGSEPLPQNPPDLEPLREDRAGEVVDKNLTPAPAEQRVKRDDALTKSTTPDRRDEHPVAPEPQVVPGGEAGIIVAGGVDPVTGKIIDQVDRRPANEVVDQDKRKSAVDAYAPIKGERVHGGRDVLKDSPALKQALETGSGAQGMKKPEDA